MTMEASVTEANVSRDRTRRRGGSARSCEGAGRHHAARRRRGRRLFGLSVQVRRSSDDRTDDDLVIEHDGATVLIDPVSLELHGRQPRSTSSTI